MRTLFKDFARGVRDVKAALDVSSSSGGTAAKPRAKAKAKSHAVGAALKVAQQAAQIAAMTHAHGNPYHEVSDVIYATGHAGGDGAGSDHEEAPVRRRLTGKQAPPAHLAAASSAAPSAPAVAAPRRRITGKQAPRG